MRLLSVLLVLSLFACGTPRRVDDDEDPETTDAGGGTDGGFDAGTPTDACTPNPCTESFRTRCRVSGTAAVCSCDEGYRDGASGCEPIPGNPCAPNPCTQPNRTTCSVNGDAAVCACNAGYVEEAGACVLPQTDPCEPNPCTAANRSVCVANGNVAECRCVEGFTLSGDTCVDAICLANPCTQPNRNVCVSDGIAARFCLCNEGYELQGSNCVPPGTNPCDPNPCTNADKRTCTVVGGEAVCSCTAGWTNQGGMCLAPTCSGGALPAAVQAGEVVASDPGGQTAVVWSGSGYVVLWSESRGTPAEEIWAAKIRSDGVKDGADVRLTNAPGLSWLERHGVVPTSDGFALAWIDARYTANRRDVVFARFDANLQRIGAEQRVTTDLDVEEVALAQTGSGYVVAWGNGTAAGTAGLFYQRLDPQGVPVGTPVQGHTEIVHDIALASNGTFVGLSYLTTVGIHRTWVLRADLSRAGNTSARSGGGDMTDVVWNGSKFLAVTLDQDEAGPNVLRLTAFETNGNVTIDSTTILSNSWFIYWATAAWATDRLAVLADVYTGNPASTPATTTRLHRFNAGGVELDTASVLVQGARSNAFSVAGSPNGFATAWTDVAGADVNVFFRRWCE